MKKKIKMFYNKLDFLEILQFLLFIVIIATLIFIINDIAKSNISIISKIFFIVLISVLAFLLQERLSEKSSNVITVKLSNTLYEGHIGSSIDFIKSKTGLTLEDSVKASIRYYRKHLEDNNNS